MRITPEAAESSGALVVKNVDLHEKTNALEHQTSAFECVQSSQPEAVFRRGMEIRMTITFNRPYDASKDRLSFVFLAGIFPRQRSLCFLSLISCLFLHVYLFFFTFFLSFSLSLPLTRCSYFPTFLHLLNVHVMAYNSLKLFELKVFATIRFR